MKILPKIYRPKVGDMVITLKFSSNVYNCGALLFNEDMINYVNKLGEITKVYSKTNMGIVDNGIYVSVHGYTWPIEAILR